MRHPNAFLPFLFVLLAGFVAAIGMVFSTNCAYPAPHARAKPVHQSADFAQAIVDSQHYKIKQR